MKTSSLLFAAGLILFPWCISPLLSQQQNAASPEKKITIIKHTIDADGSEVTETIVKKGKAAENFDVDKFVQENRNDQNEVQVIVNDEDEAPRGMGSFAWAGCDDKHAFLGVQPDSDEDENQPGLVVQIIRGTAADKAGLHDNDIILSLNGTKTDNWDDLSQFVSQAKPGDKINISYSRNGKKASTEAVLATRKDIKCDMNASPKGFLGIFDQDEDNDADGVAVSITKDAAAAKAGLQDGDVIFQLNDTPIADFEDISDFMAYTKPGDKVVVAYEHAGQRKSADVILGEQKGLMNGQNFNFTMPEINLQELNNLKLNLPGNINYNVKQKEACLGVYSHENEDHGAAVQSFTTESAAREAGMQEGDVILSVNKQIVNSHSELWDEIAKFKTGDKVQVAYERDGKSLQVEATLKACQDKSRVDIMDGSANGKDRRFYTWNWDKDDQRRLRETRIIIIRKAGEGDGTKATITPDAKPTQDRSLSLQAFRAYPNPSQGQVTVEFKGEPVATVVSLFDLSGRQLFREELNAFDGNYNQQFDLSAYAKGTIIIHVLQGDKVYTEQVIVN